MKNDDDVLLLLSRIIRHAASIIILFVIVRWEVNISIVEETVHPQKSTMTSENMIIPTEIYIIIMTAIKEKA